jgi:hypothetical protein
MIIRATIKLSAIDKKRFYVSPKTGEKYMSIVLMDSRYPSKYKDDGMITEDITQEEREAGTKGNILGNFKFVVREHAQQVETKTPKKTSPQREFGESGTANKAFADGESEDVPF